MTNSSLLEGAKETRRDSGLYRTRHPRILRARAVGRLQIRTTKLKKQNDPRASEVLPLETIETKKHATEEHIEKEKAQM